MGKKVTKIQEQYIGDHTFSCLIIELNIRENCIIL